MRVDVNLTISFAENHFGVLLEATKSKLRNNLVFRWIN
jgi:hypothetical protein